MKSKTIASILSFFAGSTGAQRFFLGQNERGWWYLILFYFFLPGIVWAIKYFQIVFYWEGFYFGWIFLLILIHISETVFFVRLSKEKFILQDKSRGNTWLLTSFGIVISFVLLYGIQFLIHTKNEINIDYAKPEFSFTSLEYSQGFKNDEKNFTITYGGKVLKVSGKVVSNGFDMETNTSYLVLEAVPNTSTDVNCFFNEAHQNEIAQIALGDSITIIGVCDGRFMTNCRVEK